MTLKKTQIELFKVNLEQKFSQIKGITIIQTFITILEKSGKQSCLDSGNFIVW